MPDKKKYKVKIRKQPMEVIDEILKKGDKKAFDLITGALQQIAENPEAGNPIISGYDKTLLDKLALYNGKRIDKLSTWTGSPFEDGRDFDLKIKNTTIELFGASIFTENRKISLELFIEDYKKGVYFSSADFRKCYEISLKNSADREFLIKASAIVLDDR